MAEVDWTKPTKRKWAFDFTLIPPNKLNDSWGTLENVDISSVSITEGYYTDTRIQGKLTHYDTLTQDERQAYIRITAKDTTTGYYEHLGTFIPTSDDVTMEGGILKTSLNLESTLYGISQQKLQTQWVCPQGIYSYTHIVNILENKCNLVSEVSYSSGTDRHSNSGEAGMDDRKFQKTYVTDPGSSILELLYGICNGSNTRLDVDGQGRVLFYKYVTPNDNTNIRFTITANSPDSIVLDGVTRSSNYLDKVSQVTVHAKNDDNKEFISVQTATGRLSQAQRGYIVGKYYDVNEMSPFTQARATQLAKQYLSTATNNNAEWTLTTEYMPIYCGDVGYLEGIPEANDYTFGSKVKVFIKNREIDLATMTQKLTLKLASSNDTDTGEE